MAQLIAGNCGLVTVCGVSHGSTKGPDPLRDSSATVKLKKRSLTMSMSNTEKAVNDTRRNSRRTFCAEGRIRTVLDELRGEASVCLMTHSGLWAGHWPRSRSVAPRVLPLVCRLWGRRVGRP